MLSKISVKKPFFVVVAIVIIIILGVISYLNIGVDMLPGMNLPYVAVITIYPGAAPETVEREITDPVEASLSEVGNVKNITSTSAEHYSLVFVEFNANADIDKAYNEIDAKLQTVKFPDSTLLQDPIIMKISPSMLPVMSLSVGVDGKSIKESGGVLSEAVDKIKGVDGVSGVSTSGLISDLIYVNMKVDKLVDAIMDYVYDTFGLDAVLPMSVKEDVYQSFKEADVANMTEEEAIDILIAALDDVDLGPETDAALDFVKDYLEAEKNDPDGPVYSIATQLLGNKFVFRDDADPELFYVFLDELSRSFMDSAIRSRVDSLFTKLSPDVLNQLIFAQDFSMPAGNVTEGSIETMVKVGSQLTTREEFLNLPVISFDVGAAYSEYFEYAHSIIGILRSSTGSDELSFTVDDLLSFIAVQRLAVTAESPLYEFFENNTDEEIAETVIALLTRVNAFLPGAVVLPEDPADPYVVDLNELDNAVTTLQGMLVVPLKLNSFADVTFFDNSTETLTFMVTRAKDGEDFVSSGAVIVSVNKEPDKSTVEVTNAITKLLDDLGKDPKFEGFQYTVLSNDGATINFMLNTVLQNLLWGGLLAVVVLLLFLRSIKPTIVVGSSIIISVVFTFVMMYFAGITLNIVSMGGLALGVGMLVDNSIVVIENIFRMKAQGKNVFTAAIQGAKQVSGAIIASTLTTMIVFLPIVFISGLTKEIFTDMALTICFSLLASLLVALTLVPMAASTFMKKPPRKETKIFKGVRRGYAKALNFFLKYKFIPLILVAVLFGGAIFAVFKMDIVLFPNNDASNFSITATIDREGLQEYNKGKTGSEYMTYDDAIDEVMSQLTHLINGDILIRKDPNDKNGELVPYNQLRSDDWKGAIGSAGLYLSSGLSVGGFSLGGGSISMDVILVDEKKRDVGSTFFEKEFAEILGRDEVNKGIFECTISSGGMMNSLGLGTSSYTVNLYGEDIDALRKDTIALADKFKTEGEDGKTAYTIEGIKDIGTGLETDSKEYRIVVDRSKSSVYGLTVAQVYQQVAAALAAVSASESVNLYTDDIRSNNDIYIYDTQYQTDAWYECLTLEGKSVRVYLKNNLSDADLSAEYYVLNDGQNGVFVNVGDGYVYVSSGGRIPVTPSEGKFTYTYTFEDEGGDIISETVTYNRQGREIYYDVNRIGEFDLMTMNVTSADLLGTGAEPTIVPLYKLLDDSCFVKDKDGNVVYRETALGEKIPLGFVKTDAYNSIAHENKRKITTITFTYDTEYSSNKIQGEIKDGMNDFEFTPGVEAELTSGNPYVEEVFKTLIFVLVMAVVLIYLIMVAQFQSLKSPLIIMFTIPLAFTGGIIAVLIGGQPLSVMALMGLIVLVGVVVNNGIVFVDYCNQLIKKGVPKKVALLRTGMDRLRPILMTALTTIVALIIMAADGSEGGAMLQPLAITAIGGMIFSTALTLFIVPIVYDIFNRKIKRTARDEALAKYSKEELDDDGLEDWDDESKDFVCALSKMTREEAFGEKPIEATSETEPIDESTAERTSEAQPNVEEVSGDTEQTTGEEEKKTEVKERKENAVLREIKRRRADIFGDE